MTNLIAEQESIPIWCEDCNSQGYIFIDDPEQPCFVVCKTCGWETSQVWCPKCGMGGGFVEETEKRPLNWSCPTCKTRYRLPQEFYKESVALIVEKDLSPDIRKLISSRKSILNLFKPTQTKKELIDSFYSPENKQNRRRLLLLVIAYALLIITGILVSHIK